MDKEDKKRGNSENEHVVFIDRLVDFPIQREKQKDSSSETDNSKEESQ